MSDEFSRSEHSTSTQTRDAVHRDARKLVDRRSAPNAQLRAIEERFQRALAIDTVGVLFFTLDGRITDANVAFQRMSGYTSEELRSIAHWKKLTAPEFRDVTARAGAELTEHGETAPYEKQMIRKDGSLWWGLFAPKRIGDTRHDAECVEFIIDITDRKTTEERLRIAAEALQELEERQRMALDAAELGTWKYDVATGRIELDSRARAHYGLDAPVVRIDAIMARVHPDDVASLERATAEALNPHLKRPVAAEYRVIGPNHTVRWLSVNGQVHFAPVGGSERATVGIGTTRDVTEQKRVEETLRDADRRKDEFLAILAHELRNPLAPIRTAVGILRLPNVPDRLLTRSREIIERQVAHMARLVDDLLDVSRLSRGKMSLQRARIRLDDVIDVAIETAKPLIEERDHRLTIHRTPHAITVHADLARLSQVFANLLNNAAKYTPRGGSITVEVVEEGHHVDVRVSDTGEGLAADHLEKVFDLFAQGGSTQQAGGGLGIGLALARRLVELHGGSLTAASPGVGLGATFTVRLPTVNTSLDVVPLPESPDATITHLCRRVLVVDDNADAADTTAMLLHTAGCDVRTAYGGEQALREIRDFPPDVVLLDLGMPGLDGIETCRRIRSLPNGGSILVVALTGWGQEESRRRTVLAGFDAHLVKPVAPHALLQLIEKAARGSA